MLQMRDSVEIYLLPGDLHFGDENTRIHTVLGSCISITLWHPRLHIGGMCHFMLPSRGTGKPSNGSLDGHYADEAIELLLCEIAKHKTRPDEYQVKLFGGGNMFRLALTENTFNVARDNVEAARALLDINGFDTHAEHMGGSGHRRIIFDLYDGSVLVKHEKL